MRMICVREGLYRAGKELVDAAVELSRRTDKEDADGVGLPNGDTETWVILSVNDRYTPTDEDHEHTWDRFLKAVDAYRKEQSKPVEFERGKPGPFFLNDFDDFEEKI